MRVKKKYARSLLGQRYNYFYLTVKGLPRATTIDFLPIAFSKYLKTIKILNKMMMADPS